VEKAASAKGMDAWQLATHFTQIFQADLVALNILPPQRWVKATDTIPQQIALVQQLEAKGFTYATSDGIYFDTSRLPGYGVLEPQRLAGQRAGERVDMGEKKNATDFALWKLSHPTPRHPELVSGSSQPTKKRQMEWPSPWGVGFPGWHLECSAICQDAFANWNLTARGAGASGEGAWLDIHCGGIDHVAVHHTNEIAQTQAATDRPLAKYWLHGAFLVLGGEQRMGKSEGNALTIRTLQGKMVDPLAYRYFCLQAHYRSALTFSWEAVEAAQSGWQSLRTKALALPSGQVDDAAIQKFMDDVNDDLNTAKALATLHGYVSQTGATRETVAKMDEVLGLQLLDAPASVGAPAEVRALADLREAARQAKDFARADELRQQIEAAGWTVRDTSAGFELTAH
jgi:cysteinyl-tRNA synthetase